MAIYSDEYFCSPYSSVFLCTLWERTRVPFFCKEITSYDVVFHHLRSERTFSLCIKLHIPDCCNFTKHYIIFLQPHPISWVNAAYCGMFM